MRRRIKVSALGSVIALLLLVGCQTINSDHGSAVKHSSQKQSFTVFGVSPELHEKAVKEGEKAKDKLQELEKDRSLSGTAKRILAEAEEAEEQGDEELYLAKIQEYSQLLNDEPIKRAAEAKILEGQVLFSQLRLKEALEVIEKAVKLDSTNPEYLLTLAEYLRWNGKYQKMEKVSLQALSLIESEDSIDEMLQASAYSYLGLAYLYQGKYNLANNTLQKVLEMRWKLLGEEHPEVASSLNNLALLYQSQGRYTEAEPLYQQALEIAEQALGKNHPNTNIIRANYERLKE